MTRTGRTLSEYMEMGAAGMVALLSFVNYLPADSALRSATDPQEEIGEWNTTRKTNMILADLFDVFVSANTKKGRKAKQYPRPKQKKKIGSGAIPIRDFWSWWNGGESAAVLSRSETSGAGGMGVNKWLMVEEQRSHGHM